MLTFEKILKVFQAYLDDDQLYALLKQFMISKQVRLSTILIKPTSFMFRLVKHPLQRNS